MSAHMSPGRTRTIMEVLFSAWLETGCVERNTFDFYK